MTARVLLAVKNKTFQHHFPLSDYRKGAIWEISKKTRKKWRQIFEKSKKSRRKNQGFQFLMGFVSGSGYNKKNLGPLPSRSQKWIWAFLPLFFVKNCFFEIFDENKKHPPNLPFFHKTPPSTSFQLWRDEKNAQNTTWCM